MHPKLSILGPFSNCQEAIYYDNKKTKGKREREREGGRGEEQGDDKKTTHRGGKMEFRISSVGVSDGVFWFFAEFPFELFTVLTRIGLSYLTNDECDDIVCFISGMPQPIATHFA